MEKRFGMHISLAYVDLGSYDYMNDSVKLSDCIKATVLAT
jgi:hypothetical protein